MVRAFSARANSRALFRVVDTKANPNVIDCLHGIRCLSFVWVVFCHDYLVAAMSPNINMGYVLTVSAFPTKDLLQAKIEELIQFSPLSVDQLLLQ